MIEDWLRLMVRFLLPRSLGLLVALSMGCGSSAHGDGGGAGSSAISAGNAGVGGGSGAPTAGSAAGGRDGAAGNSNAAGSGGSPTSGRGGAGGMSGSAGGGGAAGGAPGAGTAGKAGAAGAGASGGAGAAGAVGDSSAGAGGGYVWPNEQSQANSDPWLSEHHDEIVEMHPKVLVLDYANQFTQDQAQTLVSQHIQAMQWASRYHGYSDPNAKPFINYELAKIVDLTDGGSQVTSTKLPTKGANNTGEIDYAELASQDYADLIGIPDPATGQNLDLCGLFEKGLIHEVWGMVADNGSNGSGNGKFDETAETKVGYDANGQRISPLKLVAVSNGTDITRLIPCKVSVRIYDFNPTRGPGCHLHAAGHAWENYISRGALPSFAKVAATFFNFDFDQRFGAGFKSFYNVCPYTSAVCIDWQSDIHASAGPAAMQSFDFPDMSAGCGNVHFPPNATTQYTTAGDELVQTSCEHYGLHDGTGGKDMTSPYQDAIALKDYQSMGADTRKILYDCGGTQPAYIFASMPGLGNHATAADGTPMKNWWVYYYY